MTTQPIGPQSASSSPHWYKTSATCNRSYLLAGLRAGLIALVLLAVLAVIVWVCSTTAGDPHGALVLAVRAAMERGYLRQSRHFANSLQRSVRVDRQRSRRKETRG